MVESRKAPKEVTFLAVLARRPSIASRGAKRSSKRPATKNFPWAIKKALNTKPKKQRRVITFGCTL